MKLQVDVSPETVLEHLTSQQMLEELARRDDARAELQQRSAVEKAREYLLQQIEDNSIVLPRLLEELYLLHCATPLPRALRDAARALEPDRTRFMV